MIGGSVPAAGERSRLREDLGTAQRVLSRLAAAGDPVLVDPAVLAALGGVLREAAVRLHGSSPVPELDARVHAVAVELLRASDRLVAS